MYFQILLSALIGGLVNLDTFHIAQTMVSRPLCICPLLGLILGTLNGSSQEGLHLGAIAGVILELLWMNTFMLGVYVPSNATISSITAISLLCIGLIGSPFEHSERLTFLILTICFAFIIGKSAKWVDFFLYKKINTALLYKLEDSIKAKEQRIGWINWTSIGICFGVYFLLLIGIITVGLSMVKAGTCFLATKFDLTVFLPLLLLLGCGITISIFGIRKYFFYFIAGFLLTTILIMRW
ncbi:MAG: PTS sugar transporter subunit IIC [bacterium]|nr:PTS sugar transporter subunit IIC [bacterium]